MLVKNITINQMYKAIRELNRRYDDNIIFNREPEPVGNQLRFTIKVKNSKGKGAKLSLAVHSGKVRHTRAACWHVHGDLFDIILDLYPCAVISSSGSSKGPIKIYKSQLDGLVVGNWYDWNIGSELYPMLFSDSCKCNDQ